MALLLASTATGAFAQDAASPDGRDARIRALEEQIQALAQQVADLKESTTASINDVRTIATATPVTIANGKPVIQSADGAFSANLHGVFQFDAANYNQKSGLTSATTGADLNSGTNFRRARIGIDGKFFTNWDYNLLFDFGGTGTDAGAAGSTGGTITNASGAALHEGWIQYSGFKLGGTYPVRIRAGAFAPSLGLEDAASTNGSLFIERPSPSEIARSIAGADKRIALQVLSNGDHWLAAAAWTGARTGDPQTYDEQSSYTARVAGTPLFGFDWRLHIGANASYIARPAQTTSLGVTTSVGFGDRPELRVDGTQLVATGGIDARHASHYGAELAYQKGPFLIQGEYFRYDL
ncbi:MAG: porin, partial [Brevundimonas sp.]